MNGIEEYPHIISDKIITNIRKIVDHFFTTKILQKIEGIERPIKEVYSDLVERKHGRFEIIPSLDIQKNILEQLRQSFNFDLLREKCIRTLQPNYGVGSDNNSGVDKIREELCILAIEPNSEMGDWHRDVYIYTENDYTKDTYYITQIIYLDDVSGTEFCEYSEGYTKNTFSDSDLEKYRKKTIQSYYGSSILFDGRNIHRGLENNTSSMRYALYVAYSKIGYIDKESNLPYIFL
jgi:hypothetical protein